MHAVAALQDDVPNRAIVNALGQLLQGAGVAVLYLTVFAAAKAFGVMPPLVAFGLMIANFTALAMEPQGQIAGTASSLYGSITTLLGIGVAEKM